MKMGLVFPLPIGERVRVRGYEAERIEDHPLTSVLSPVGRGGEQTKHKDDIEIYT